MSKDRRTVSLDSKTDEYLSQEGVNASQLVNRLVKNYATAGGNERSMLELRESQLESEINELQGRVENKEDELAEVRDQLAGLNSEVEQVLDKASDALSQSDLQQENRKVEFWAEESGLSVPELKDELESRL